MDKKEVFYCRYEEENSQRYLEESRAERQWECRRLTMARGFTWQWEKQEQTRDIERGVERGRWWRAKNEDK